MATEGISGTKRNLHSGTGIGCAMREILEQTPEIPTENSTMTMEQFPLDTNKIALAAQRNYDWEELADYLDVPVQDVIIYKDHPEFKRAQARGRRLRKDKIYDGFDALVTEKHPRMIELGAKCDLGMNPTQKVETEMKLELTEQEKKSRLQALLAKASR